MKKIKPLKHEPHSDYHKIWRIVDGAVRDCFKHHPDYLTGKGHVDARTSIVKRVTGAIHGVQFPKGKVEPGPP